MEQQVALDPLRLRAQEEDFDEFDDEEFGEGFGEEDDLDLGIEKEDEY